MILRGQDFRNTVMKGVPCFRLAQEVIAPMVQCVWSARHPLSCMTGCTLDLWLPCLLYFIGSLLTSSQREKEKGTVYVES